MQFFFKQKSTSKQGIYANGTGTGETAEQSHLGGERIIVIDVQENKLIRIVCQLHRVNPRENISDYGKTRLLRTLHVCVCSHTTIQIWMTVSCTLLMTTTKANWSVNTDAIDTPVIN